MAKKPTTLVPADLKTTPLWLHQRKAVSQISTYPKAFTADNSIGSALIHLPTGTGKTGVKAEVRGSAASPGDSAHFRSRRICLNRDIEEPHRPSRWPDTTQTKPVGYLTATSHTGVPGAHGSGDPRQWPVQSDAS